MAKSPEPKKSKRLIFTSSHKGGVGKTILARLMTEIYRKENVPATIFDADGSVGGLARMYAKPMDVKFYSFRDNPNTLLDSIDAETDVIMHDLPGGSLPQISNIVDGGNGEVSGFLDALEEHGVRLTVLHVIDSEIESTQSVREVMKVFDPTRVDHVVAINMRESKTKETDFPYWFGYDVEGKRKYGNTRDDFISANGIEIEIPALQVGTRAKVNGQNIPFSEASGSKLFTISERSQISKFLKSFEAGLEPARKILGLS